MTWSNKRMKEENLKPKLFIKAKSVNSEKSMQNLKKRLSEINQKSDNLFNELDSAARSRSWNYCSAS